MVFCQQTKPRRNKLTKKTMADPNYPKSEPAKAMCGNREKKNDKYAFDRKGTQHKLGLKREADMANFQSMVEEVKALIQKELKNKDNRPSYMLEKQLYLILDEVEKMEKIRDIHLFYPYYPKGIADSWDNANPLAIKLSDLLELYREL